MVPLIWVNTVVILFALVGGGIIVMSQLRKIAEALAQVGRVVERVEEAAVKIQETASRSERISVAILQRLSVGDNSQA
jgi:ArsR family metal-binding transcriptional regulator